MDRRSSELKVNASGGDADALDHRSARARMAQAISRILGSYRASQSHGAAAKTTSHDHEVEWLLRIMS